MTPGGGNGKVIQQWACARAAQAKRYGVAAAASLLPTTATTTTVAAAVAGNLNANEQSHARVEISAYVRAYCLVQYSKAHVKMPTTYYTVQGQ